MVVLSRSWQREWDESSAASISLSVTWDRRRFSEFAFLILSLEMRVPSIDIYHRIRNPSMDEKVELQYRLRWLSQGSISKVPQSMVDASLELYPIPYSMLKLLCLSEPKRKPGAWEAMQNLKKGICFPSLSSEVRFSFNIDIPMTMDQLRSTKQKANEIFLLGRSIPRNGDPFCRSIPLWLALLGMLLTILGHS
ncbi:hypothetical protein L1987_89328 [Smallanthus sonchifolius]|nr:hypothetical protein L1987_89328 [Smallanthus sonchifolius]